MGAAKSQTHTTTGLKDPIVIEDATKYGLTCEHTSESGFDYEVQAQLQKDGEWYGVDNTGSNVVHSRTRSDVGTTLRTHTTMGRFVAPVYAARVLIGRIPAGATLRFELLKDDE